MPGDCPITIEAVNIYRRRITMEVKWMANDFNFDQIILAGDIGGTNTNLALVGRKADKFTIIVECIYKSSEVTNLTIPVKEVIATGTAKKAGLKIDFCCISAAGPVENNYCKLTNCSWAIDGNEIKKATGINTLVINDFLAVGYGIPTLNVDDKAQVTKLPGTDGKVPKQSGNIKLAVGAGTGLGVGFLIAQDGKYHAYPSEGGHSGFGDFDDETKELKAFVAKKYSGTAPGTEPFVSGQGITNIFNFYKETKKMAIEGVIAEIDKVKDEEKPALISKNAATNATCKKIMQLFVAMFGRFAGSISVIFLPMSGVYLAGGIAAKNEELLLENNLFMKNFEVNYNPNIQPLLKKIPVYIVKDYSISLYGAANAGYTLLGSK
jgi:glucokinase